jgi:hypothetical protein
MFTFEFAALIKDEISLINTNFKLVSFLFLMNELHLGIIAKGHFTHEPRATTMKLWEPERKCPKVVPEHLQNHVVWSLTLECSVKSYVIGPSTKCYFNEFLFMRVLTHVKIK